MRADRFLALLCTVAALTLTGCTDTRRSLAKPWASSVAATPSAAPANTDDCERFEDPDCQEWTPLRPQPPFDTLMGLVDGPLAPRGLQWSGLFLCGAFPDELLDRYLGADFLRVIINNFICVIESVDRTHFRSVNVHLGDGTLEQFAAAYANNQLRSHHTTIHGREAVEQEETANDHFANRSFLLGLPKYPQHVLVVDVRFTSFYDEDGNSVEPDREAAAVFADKVASTLVDATT